MSAISEKTSFTWPVVVTIIGAAISMGVLFARISFLTEQVAEVKEQIVAINDKIDSFLTLKTAQRLPTR